MAENNAQSEIRYLNPVSVDVKKKKYCRFKKLGIKYVDYKELVLRSAGTTALDRSRRNFGAVFASSKKYAG